MALADYVSPFRATLEGFLPTISWPTFITENKDAIILGVIIAIITTILLGIPKNMLNLLEQNKRFKPYYNVVWKKSSSLRPDEVLGLRGQSKHGFDKYYHLRENDEYIRKKIETCENVLVVGSPLAGKSRAIYQALITLENPQDVLIPKLVDINPESFQIPFHFKVWRKRVIVLDDIDKFTDVQNFNHLVQEILNEKDIIVVASCRSGPEYDKLCRKMESKLSVIFGDPVEIAKISREKGGEISREIGIDLPSEFDGNIGSIFIKLETMRERFKACDGVEKGILRSIKRLYYAGIYNEREVFSVERIKRVCETIEEIDLKNYEWKKPLDNLKRAGLIEIAEGEGRLLAEEAYLQYVIENGLIYIDNLKSLKDIFSEDPEALFNIGTRACNLGLVDIQKRNYLLIAIESYKEALNVCDFNRVPIQHAAAQNNLGSAYSLLADVEDKAENCTRAIEAYQEALKVRTLDQFPIDYAATQNNMGNAYSTLAEIKDRAENCKRAIEAYREALKVRTLDQFPIDYAGTQNNMGNAYSMLADVEDKAENCKRAIKACQEGFKVRTLDQFSMDYAATQNNMGNAYRRLAEVAKNTENKAENCKKAIEAYQEALTVRTLDQFPTDYAATQNNLGATYQTLARVEDQAENCKRAIKTCQEAFEVYTLGRFPMDYAMTQNTLGNAYKTLAEVEDKAENCKRAIKAYQKALKIFTEEEFPEINHGVERNLVNVLDFCKGE